MIIEYTIRRTSPYGYNVESCVCCGKFESWWHFNNFVSVCRFNGQIVSNPKELR